MATAATAVTASVLPNDVIGKTFGFLPCIYQLYVCSRVDRAWNSEAKKLLAARRLALERLPCGFRGAIVEHWKTKDPPPKLDYRTLAEYAALAATSRNEVGLLASRDAYVSGAEQQLRVRAVKANGHSRAAGCEALWIGVTSAVDALCLVGDDCIAAALTARTDPWDDDVGLNCLRGDRRRHLALYDLRSAADVWHTELAANHAGDMKASAMAASPNANHLVLSCAKGLLRYRCDRRAADGTPQSYCHDTPYLLARPVTRDESELSQHPVLLCGDDDLYVATTRSMPIWVHSHRRGGAWVRTLRTRKRYDDDVSDMCFLGPEQAQLAVVTVGGSLEVICPRYGTVFRRFPTLVRRFSTFPTVAWTADGRLLVAHESPESEDAWIALVTVDL